MSIVPDHQAPEQSGPWEPTVGRCNARRTTGQGLCRRGAGQGTSHAGIGTCSKHGGSTRTHVTAAMARVVEAVFDDMREHMLSTDRARARRIAPVLEVSVRNAERMLKQVLYGHKAPPRTSLPGRNEPSEGSERARSRPGHPRP